MMELAFIGISFIFAYFALNFRGEAWRSFFLLMSFLFIFLTIITPSIETQHYICEQVNVNGTCVQNRVYVTIAGQEALIFGFGLVLVAIFILTMLSLFVKATKAI